MGPTKNLRIDIFRINSELKQARKPKKLKMERKFFYSFLLFKWERSLNFFFVAKTKMP